MKLPARLSFLLTGIILSAVMVVLAASRPEYCGQPSPSSPQLQTAADASSPTLAPPQKVVVLSIEADKPDLEIGWAKN
jgi:hypothetical protein